MTGPATPPELPPGLLEEYLGGMRALLDELSAIAERLARVGSDREALDRLRHETHKIRGSAGSYGFMDASRLAAGMEATVKDWVARPDDPEVNRGSLAYWFVARVAELHGLPIPRALAAAPPMRVGPPPRPGQSVAKPARAQPVGTPPPPPPPVPPLPKPAVPTPAPQTHAIAARTSPGPRSPAPPEVIFVEDDAALAELLEYGLRARGYRFAAFRNGREALRQLLALDVQGTTPLLLLDVDLPALDGYSIFDALQRERPGTYRVVFTTVHGTEDEQLRGLEAGALDYLVKPLSLRVALEKIKRWVGR